MGTLTFENVGKQLEAIIEEEFLSQSNEPHYYNEAQVQHKLGIELYKRFGIEPTLEWYVKNDESGAKEYIDMMFEIDGKRVAIELKYKTRAVKGEDAYVHQGGQSDGKFHFFKDIERLERLKTPKSGKAKIDKGFAIFITNDHLYWNEVQKGKPVAKFNLCDNKEGLHGKYPAKWGKHNNEKVILSGTYPVEWFPLSDETKKDGTIFRCLIITL
ncbi:hypothetical protein [Treponema socranskii]|uniref:hypothetical protein n=1 Tax=Treponema socranskii TaxID=53419 RepID=UPI003D8D5CB6